MKGKRNMNKSYNKLKNKLSQTLKHRKTKRVNAISDESKTKLHQILRNSNKSYKNL